MPDPHEVRSMFARIAGTYDGLNRGLSMGVDQRWRRKTVAKAGALSGKRVLDLCCGTGDLSLLFAEQGAQVVGADFTHEMVSRAPGKAQRRRAAGSVVFVQGDAQALPVSSDHFDVASVAFGIRNVEDPARCLGEMWRALKPGGLALVLEFPPPGNNPIGQSFRLYFRHILPVIGGVVARDREAYRYLPRTVLAWPKPLVFTGWMQQAGFESVDFQTMTGGIACLHWGTKPATARAQAPAPRA
ncbi:MAG: bifunctional demethylmenaquinone methyltransferase/2-methoxy-6-polyprenyl-1,4-benzoquinol methylase UbiE [Planctomycetes bacterium]|nr:bifunctional demethylmenaquinone methyltransferase/2-methoxy-6-polyprenyl-1,4-benzoquinol methylase UbiE [Planctomycetota bacterium]